MSGLLSAVGGAVGRTISNVAQAGARAAFNAASNVLLGASAPAYVPPTPEQLSSLSDFEKSLQEVFVSEREVRATAEKEFIKNRKAYQASRAEELEQLLAKVKPLFKEYLEIRWQFSQNRGSARKVASDQGDALIERNRKLYSYVKQLREEVKNDQMANFIKWLASQIKETGAAIKRAMPPAEHGK